MKLYSLLLSIAFLFPLYALSTLAIGAAPGVFHGYNCDIELTVHNATYIESYYQEPRGHGCDWGQGHTVHAHYSVSVSFIQTFSNFSGKNHKGETITCKERVNQSEIFGLIIYENKTDVFQKGQIIRGLYHPRLNPCGTTSLGNYTIVQDVKKPNNLFINFIQWIKEILNF